MESCFVINMAFQINGEQMHYSVKSVDSWVTSWGKKNKPKLDICLTTKFETDQRFNETTNY